MTHPTASSPAVGARTVTFPEHLPVAARREEIMEAIAGHQVVIVAGETGSGKTTQLPKMCLALGLDEHGTIGHTQPRRIAARSVAERIAEELQELADQSAVVLTAPEVLAGGIYGPSGAAVPEHVRGRLPDVLVLGRGSSVMVDPRRRAPGSSPEIGVHGSLTEREALVPLLQVEA